MLDAVGRTLVRLFITRRRLLEWVTAAHAKKSSCHSYYFFFRRMLGAEIIAFASFLMTAILDPEALPVASPFILLWFISPFVARKISMPPATRPIEILPARRRDAPPFGRSADLAILHHLRDRHGSLAPPRQFSGRAASGHRSPQFPDQFRPLSSLGRRRP